VRIVIAKKTLSTVGGSEMLARGLDRELRALGHDVTLVGMLPAWSRPGIADDSRSTFLRVRGGRLGAAIDGVFPTTFVREADLRRAVSGADVVHSLAREWAGALERAARAEGAAFVETPLVHPGQLLSGDATRDIARYRRDDAVIALTEWEAGWYRRHGVQGVHVSGIGPNLLTLPAIPREPATTLFVGRKERYKGYHALRDAAAIVWAERPDARFIAIGQPAWYARFSPPPRDPRWEESPGVVAENAKAAAFARASIFAMPSDHETFGFTYLEAWMAGLPVVAGDIPALREVVREGVDGLHARNEPRAVAGAILSLLRDPERASLMGQRGRERAMREFTWTAVAKKTESAYRDAVALRQPQAVGRAAKPSE
jgi:glycosyltransferase involved in cell wall biosynthesis